MGAAAVSGKGQPIAAQHRHMAQRLVDRYLLDAKGLFVRLKRRLFIPARHDHQAARAQVSPVGSVMIGAAGLIQRHGRG